MFAEQKRCNTALDESINAIDNTFDAPSYMNSTFLADESFDLDKSFALDPRPTTIAQDLVRSQQQESVLNKSALIGGDMTPKSKKKPIIIKPKKKDIASTDERLQNLSTKLA